MGHQEKQSIVSIIGLVLVISFYSLYIYNNFICTDITLLDDFQFWGKSFLLFIPIGIAVQIVIHIVFAIVNRIVTREDMPCFTDERDKLIELKTIRISHWIFITGFLLAMGALAMGMRPYIMFLTLIASAFVSGLASELAKIYYYRRGI